MALISSWATDQDRALNSFLLFSMTPVTLKSVRPGLWFTHHDYHELPAPGVALAKSTLTLEP